MGTELAETNYYRLAGTGVQVTYQLTRRGERLRYEGTLDDDQRDVTFKAAEGEIESLESKIGKILTVELNPEEAAADAPLVTLTLLVPQVSLESSERFVESQAVVTTHLFPRLGFSGGPHRSYEVVPLEGTASHVD